MIRYLRDIAVFAPCYLLLDWVSYIHPLGPFNITPWNPQAALAICWMLLGGLRYLPAVFATIVAADLVIRGVPAGPTLTAVAALTLAGGYGAIAFALQRLLPQPRLSSRRGLTLFVAIVAGGSALLAAAFIGVLLAADAMAESRVLAGWLRFWVGDGVGILVTAPLLLAATDGESRRSLRALAARGETAVQVALLLATLWLIFAGLGGDPSHHFYLLFLPLIWIALRSGMAGAIVAIALVQIGVVVGIHHQPLQTLPMIELQALVAALTLTGLYLGVTVDERERSAEGLRQSLRLAAAGEMAGAIAHEVNQPLTALVNYGRSGQMLIEAGRTTELAGVIERILGEAQRAGEVVRRLRDFFRQGSTRLEPLSAAELVDCVRRIGTSVHPERPVALTVQAEPQVPDLLVDRMQIEIVLRNLISNAAEAAEAHAPGSGEVAVSVRRHDAKHVRIVVADNGPGVAPALRSRAFEPFVSGKPSGMGLGLAVSRAIAEAHGGTLEARAAAHGEFHLVLPAQAHG